MKFELTGFEGSPELSIVSFVGESGSFSFPLDKNAERYEFQLVILKLIKDSKSISKSDEFKAFAYFANELNQEKYEFTTVKYQSSKEINNEYSIKPELHHTFKPDIVPQNPLIAHLFTLLTLSPWLFLLGSVISSLT